MCGSDKMATKSVSKEAISEGIKFAKVMSTKGGENC